MKSIQITLEDGLSVGAQVYNLLREQIVHADIPPGTQLSEAEISRNLSVSRQPVREAFIKLHNDGLVEIRPQRGTFVTKISIAAVSDARFVREAVEADIVKLLTRSISDEQLNQLKEMLKQQKQLGDDELDRFYELDEQFHRFLAELAGKSSTWKIISNMKAHFDRVRHLSATQKPMQRLIDQHSAVVDAIAARDPEKADEAIRYHLNEVLRDLPKVVSYKPDMFDEDGS